MQTHIKYKVILFLLAAVCLHFMAAGAAWAVTYDLVADKTTVTLPDGRNLEVWGFGLDTGGTPNITVPGPALKVPPGEGLTINLTNNLSEPVSLHILGQSLSNNGGPVFDGNTKPRVMSFTHEAGPNGGQATYIWSSFNPGTYMLQSGTNPAKQVQMGLYAAVTKDAAAGEAYSNVSYDKEFIVLFHEFDPNIHDAVAAGNYGPGGSITSSVHRSARYFQINGKSFDDSKQDGGGLKPMNQAVPFSVGDRVLLRFINAGLDTHVPQILGAYMSLVAEDGVPYPYSKEQYGFELPAAKTMDAIFIPEEDGMLPLYDAGLKMSNAGASPGGMLAYLSTSGQGLLISFQDYAFAPGDHAVNPYDPAVQDGTPAPTGFAVEDGGGTLHLSKNAWKKINFDYEVTADTVLSFEFMSAAPAEIHGIGFDTDDVANNTAGNGKNYVFQLSGTQTWNATYQDFNNYAGPGWQAYEISVGTFFTGPMKYLVFLNDDDGSQTGEGLFRNIQIRGTTTPAAADTLGPVAFGAAVTPDPTDGATTVTLSAQMDDSGTGGSNIAGGEWWSGDDQGQGKGSAMNAGDAAFDSPTETLTADIDVSAWAPGAYNLFVRAYDASGNWGLPVSVSFTVSAADTQGPVVSNAAASPNPTDGATSVNLTAIADDSTTGGSAIASAEWWEGADPGAGSAAAMSVDGSGNLSAAVDVSAWTEGGHTVSIRAKDAAGNWGDPVQVIVQVTPSPADTVTITRARYIIARDRLVVFATSSDQPNVSLSVTATWDDNGTPATRTWSMNWNGGNDRYQRAINRFAERWGVPSSVEVNSDGGGTATQAVDIR